MIIKFQEQKATIFLTAAEVSKVILSFLYSNLRFESPNSPFPSLLTSNTKNINTENLTENKNSQKSCCKLFHKYIPGGIHL
jgi:hypothetical protein